MAPDLPPGVNLPSPKFNRQLVVPRQPSLWFSPAKTTSLRSPVNCPSALTRCLGTMKSEMPRVPAMVLPSAPGILASTRWMMFSLSSCSPAEIHILLPFKR